MEPEIIKMLIIGGVIILGTLVPGVSIGWMGSTALKAVGRNPEAAPKIQVLAILAIAFAEALAIYALVISLILKFVE